MTKVKLLSALYESVWNEGNIETKCKFNSMTGRISNIHVSNDGSEYENHEYDRMWYNNISYMVSDDENGYFLDNGELVKFIDINQYSCIINTSNQLRDKIMNINIKYRQSKLDVYTENTLHSDDAWAEIQYLIEMGYEILINDKTPD